ncbi:hypothetical protein [Paenibacillus agricola]|uniref:hypothetical protein n=1 Tax=Paenibacillus agricola TaxID=2716264 RepID=UPI001A9EB4FA|nr:hypothetical protein [Paenibacillus agricola]
MKTDLLSAVSKQEQVKSYQFKGSIELKADGSLMGGATSPMAAAMFAFLKESKVEYSGLTTLEPAQMEAAFKVTPTGSSNIDIPVLIKDNKLFFHIPALNKDEEYLMLPIQNKQGAAAAIPADALKNPGQLATSLNTLLVSGINPEWLQNSKDPVQLPDGSSSKRITLDINKKNEQAFNDYWSQSLPGLMDVFKSNGLISATALDAWQKTLKQVQFRTPSTISFLIDEQGFIHEQNWSLSFTANGSTNINHLAWTQTLSDLNQTPAFTKEVPAKQKSVEDLLKLINPAAAKK